MQHRIAMAWAGVLGATGVGLGAFGAHALKGILGAAGTREIWETAARYQLLHACALLGLAGWLRGSQRPQQKSAAWVVRLWVLGTVLFSASLYNLALGAPKWLGIITPFGGAALIAGWILVIVTALAG